MHLPALIQDLAIILGVAALVTLVFRLIRQPVVLGYVIAGVIVGPHTPAVFSVADVDSIKVWAELGVIFLMFSLGLEFSFRRLARVGLPALITGSVQIVAMLFLGVMVARLFGWTRMDAIFLGCMIAISSTTIIIKALEELGLKQRKFAELVFGILIVEDLAAILMLVALTSIATSSSVSGTDLLIAGGKLTVVVAAWFVVGMFAVPRLVKSVSKHGTDEMLTVLATGLCLALVALAAAFHYSVALGAFIMGSIIAESAEAKRIEHLIAPLRDIFAAVFFVSVGMLLDPGILVREWEAVAVITLVIIGGKLVAVTLGALCTGQGIRIATQTGLSMAQIGEFSFIIASLGLTYNVIGEQLYPVIIAASVLTTFTTPYMIKMADPSVALLEKKLPTGFLELVTNYSAWLQRRTHMPRTSHAVNALIKWGLNAAAVITIYTFAARFAVPAFQSLDEGFPALTAAWLAGFVASSPCILAMTNAFKHRDDEASRGWRHGSKALAVVATTLFLGLVSAGFFPARWTLAASLTVCLLALVLFRKRVAVWYRWLEAEFKSGFQNDVAKAPPQKRHDKFAPWDAHLVEIKVPPRSFLAGKTLSAAGLREKFNVTVIVIARDGDDIVAPPARETIYPGDRLLCFATDANLELLKQALQPTDQAEQTAKENKSYVLEQLAVGPTSPILGQSIKASKLRDRFDCMVVGLERGPQRIQNPDPDTTLVAGDRLWVVGSSVRLRELATLASS